MWRQELETQQIRLDEREAAISRRQQTFQQYFSAFSDPGVGAAVDIPLGRQSPNRATLTQRVEGNLSLLQSGLSPKLPLSPRNSGDPLADALWGLPLGSADAWSENDVCSEIDGNDENDERNETNGHNDTDDGLSENDQRSENEGRSENHDQENSVADHDWSREELDGYSSPAEAYGSHVEDEM